MCFVTVLAHYTAILYGVFGIVVVRPSVTDVLWLTVRASRLIVKLLHYNN